MTTAEERRPLAGRVAVVTGGGGGIGAEVAVELGRQGAAVVVVDPGVGVEGEPLDEPTAEAAAARVAALGVPVRSSTASVTDRHALARLFDEVEAEFGHLDIVVNPAGIIRTSRGSQATEDDWWSVLDVHLNGYLNVLAEALPRLAAGGGRVVGFTSGVGLARTPGPVAAYGCAKRAVAALTWQLGRITGPGVAVNALSPIAATRMVRQAIGGPGVRGLDLSAMPQPEHMAPAAAYLAGDRLAALSGRVVFSAGPELSVIGPPRLLEVVRTDGPGDFATALDTLVPVVLAPAEATQVTSGGSNPRFGPVYGLAAGAEVRTAAEPRPACLVVAADRSFGAAVARAVELWGLEPLGVGPDRPFDRAAAEVPSGFVAAWDTVRRAAAGRELRAVVVALAGPAEVEAESAEQLIEAHRPVAAAMVAHAGWVRAAADLAGMSGEPLRVAMVVRASDPAGRTTAQAVTQLARGASERPSSEPLDAFAVAVEEPLVDPWPLAQLVARLVGAQDTAPLAGAELAAGRGWVGLRSHPAPLATVSFDGPGIPAWVDGRLAEAAAAAGW
jgi:NAD(P)-dependent dehydrogenase (short-subunit alcohol dehydrogenase family)